MSGAGDRRAQARLEREWEADINERQDPSPPPARPLNDPQRCTIGREGWHRWRGGQCLYCGQRRPGATP